MLVKNFNLTDTMFNLPYYGEFVGLAQEYITSHKLEPGQTFVVVSSDLYNFKYINRLYGHELGNSLLIDFVSKIAFGFDNCVIACRPYSDHLIGLYIDDSLNPEMYIERIKAFNESFYACNRQNFPAVSLWTHNGVYIMTDTEESFESACDKANIARRSVKGKLNVHCCFYEESMLAEKDRTMQMVSAFDRALKNESICVFLQPKVQISTQQVVGAEALARIFTEDGELLSPVDFIPVLERSGRIVELDWYIIKKTFMRMRRWIDAGYDPMPVSINLSRLHFFDRGLVDNLYATAVNFGIPVDKVEFEVTETVFFQEEEVIAKQLCALRKLGFHVSLDDFGTGYSMLSALGMLPVDVIKLDRGFLHSSFNSKTGPTLIAGLIDIFSKIDLGVICEGVETEAEEHMLVECGCDYVQGFYYEHPLKADDFESRYIISNDRAAHPTAGGDANN